MENLGDEIMVTENELHYLIATSDRIRTYAKISNLDDERDIDSLAMLIKEAYITKGFDTMYEILSPYLKVNYSKPIWDKPSKYLEKSSSLKMYRGESKCKDLLKKINKDLFLLKEYVLKHEDLEYTKNIVIMCNYIQHFIEVIYKDD